jgi:hypothetical protein
MIEFEPFHAYYTCKPAPDIADLGKQRVHLVGGNGDAVSIATPGTAWDKNHNPHPNQGRWYRVLTVPEPNRLELSVGDIVCCRLGMRSHLVEIGPNPDEPSKALGHAFFSEQFVVSRMIKDDAAKALDHHPLGAHVLTRRCDEKNKRILNLGALAAPESLLGMGQKTSEPVRLDPQEEAQRAAQYRDTPPERENDGVRVRFEEVIAVGPGARVEPGDMLAYKPLAATQIDFMGVTVNAVPYAAQLGRVPARCFEPDHALSVADLQPVARTGT